MAEVALRWISNHSLMDPQYGDSVLIGASSLTHIEQASSRVFVFISMWAHQSWTPLYIELAWFREGPASWVTISFWSFYSLFWLVSFRSMFSRQNLGCFGRSMVARETPCFELFPLGSWMAWRECKSSSAIHSWPYSSHFLWLQYRSSRQTWSDQEAKVSVVHILKQLVWVFVEGSIRNSV